MIDDSISLRVDGPIVDVDVADRDRPQDAVASVSMLIDTGAELTVVPRDAIDALGIPRMRDVEIAGVVPQAFVPCPVFRIVLHVAGVPFDVDVAALPREEVAGGILGRDVLAHLVLLYDGPRGVVSLKVNP